MKKSITSLFLLAGLYATAQVKVGDNPNTINASAVLEMESTNKGLLPPRLTTGQRDAISNPAKGLAIFNTTSNSLEVNTGTPASPVWSSAKSGDVNNTTLTSSTSPAGTSLGQMMYNTGAVQPTGLVYWDGTQWKSVASSGGDTTNNFPVTNNSTVTNNNPVTNNSTSTFNGVSTFNDQAVFNDTAVFNGGMKVGNLPQGAVTDSLMVFEPNTKEVRRLSIAGAAAAGEPWYKVGTTAGATANTDDVYLNGKVGVGTNTPATTLHVSSTGNYGINIERTSAAGAPRLHFYKNNGTVIGSPAAVTNGSTLGAIDFYAHNGTSYPNVGNPGASIFSLATEDQTASAKGTNLAFKTNTNGSASSAERMRIDHNGNVGIGTTTPDAKLHISGDASSNFKNSTIYSTNTGTGGHSWSFGARPRGTAGDFAISDETDAATRMTLQGGTGNVGIGTSSPIEKLDVAGNLILRNSSVAGGNKHISIKNSTGLDRWAMGMGVAESGSGNAGGNFYLWNYADDGSLLGNPFVINRATGNVGVGTGTPAQKLDVTGNLALRNSSINGGNKNISIQTSAGVDRWGIGMGVAETGSGNTGGNFYIWNYKDDGAILGSPLIIERSTGNVGIGTGSPSGKLDISSAGPTIVNIANTGDNQASLDFTNNGVKRWRLIDQATTNNLTIFDQDNNAERLHIDGTTGYVAIGGGISPKAPLHIGGTTSSSFSTGAYTYFDFSFANGSGVTRVASSSSNTSASIIAEGNIWSKLAIVSTQSMTFSDSRIKNIIGQSNASKDLDLLNKIRITDYRMKDVVMQGNKQYKKVIAQEVEAIYPEAVTTQTGFVPNIYQPADKVVSLGNNTYKASFKNKVEYNQNVTGDLKLYDEQKEITAKVVSKGDNEIVFTTAEEMKGDKLFLFGEEVTDFRAVDYEALSTLNISATQELYREIQALKKQNAVLTAQVGDTKKLETAYAELAAQVKAMQEVLNMPKVQDGTVAERR